MRTASWTSASVAPACGRRRDVGGGQVERLAPDGPGDVEQRLHLVVEAVGRAELDRRRPAARARSSPLSLEQRGRERAVRVHAEEAVVRRRDGRREHLALGALERRAREVVDEQLVGEAAQVDAETGRQPHRDADPRHVGQAADDRLLLRAQEALVVACHAGPSSFVRPGRYGVDAAAARRRPTSVAGRLRILGDRHASGTPVPHECVGATASPASAIEAARDRPDADRRRWHATRSSCRTSATRGCTSRR